MDTEAAVVGRRMRALLLTALCALIAMPAGFAAELSELPKPPEPIASQPFEMVVLDPVDIHARAGRGEAVTLPTVWGSVTVIPLARVSEGVDVYQETPDGSFVLIERHVPDVWHVESEDGGFSGLLFANGLQVRATLVGDQGRSTIEPGTTGIPSGGIDVLHRMYNEEPTPATAVWDAPSEPGHIASVPPITIMSHSTKTMVAYVDNEFVSVWGDYAGHVLYLTNWINTYMDDVHLTYVA